SASSAILFTSASLVGLHGLQPLRGPEVGGLAPQAQSCGQRLSPEYALRVRGDPTKRHERGAEPDELEREGRELADREAAAEARERAVEGREGLSARRDRSAEERERVADERDRMADEREVRADER